MAQTRRHFSSVSISDDFKEDIVKSRLGKVAQLFEKSGIDIDEIGKIEKIKMSAWQGLTKNEDGDAEIHDLGGISVVVSPKWAEGPEWPVIQQAPQVKLPKDNTSEKPATEWKTCVILPDIQAGYFRDINGNLISTHDEAALDICIAFIKKTKPDLIVMNGDNADFPELGKYRLTPAFQRTTQATVDYLAMLMARMRASAPNARIVWLEGNHEARLTNYMLDNAMAAFGLKQGDKPESWPVLSIPYLCRFDEYGIEYLPGYPASQFWINNRLRVIHGHKVASGGSTAHKYLATEKTSVIYGHIHRREWAERTRNDWDGDKTILAVSAGCLARVDGAVPSTKGGNDLDGRPIRSTEDWQQGIAVVTYQEGEGNFHLELVPIRDSKMFYRGKIWESNV
jgi:metallophosphoesterase superfamily enzyme